MFLSSEHKAKLLTATREMAAAFLEDLHFLREVIARQETSRAEVRRASAVVRRLIVDRDIAKIATPRTGRILLRAPDNSDYYKAEKNAPYMLFASARIEVFGHWLGPVAVKNAKRPETVNMENATAFLFPEAVNPERTVDLRLEGFLNQQVLCFMGRWVSRESVVKYVANYASGVHSKESKEAEHHLLNEIRRSMSFKAREGGVQIVSLLDNVLKTVSPEFQHTPDVIDIVLVELLATAYFLTVSPGVIELEHVVQNELTNGQPPS